MANLRAPTPTFGRIAALACILAAACSDGAADGLAARKGASASTETVDGGTGRGGEAAGPPAEELLFRALEPTLEKKCGGSCHTDATYRPAPPAFLAHPDAYTSIKSYPGLVTKDVYASALISKGSHAGPALSTDPEFEKKVVAWLEAEVLALSSQRHPTIDAAPLKSGPNDLDLTKACSGGLRGVRLKFDATVVGTSLSIANLRVSAPAGTDVHVLKPRFIKVLAAAKPDVARELPDPTDTFSNVDQTVSGGAETVLSTGSAMFANLTWGPWNFATDKIRIEFAKIEPGKVAVFDAPKGCKDPTAFATNVLPNLKGGGGFGLTCTNCHGGQAGLSWQLADPALVCQQVLTKLNEADISQSVMITKVTKGPHTGGMVTNQLAWAALFTSNAGVFF